MGMSGRWSDLFRGRPQPRQHAAYGGDGLMRRAPDLEQRMTRSSKPTTTAGQKTDVFVSAG